MKGKFSNDDINYIVDWVYEFYKSKGFLDDDADEQVEIYEDELTQYIIKNAQKDGIGKFFCEEIVFIVRGELAYCDSIQMFN